MSGMKALTLTRASQERDGGFDIASKISRLEPGKWYEIPSSKI
jgi:hypothetical protein